ncbi:soluble liver antigen/liver pancreas antigen-domain-containing protein [Pavlovales sp. CCMP2436]|nr:soluble liver antigen/liver pancreas antigen-domain-containing protein [Pavlovales sp. CCMP2436]
MNAANFALAEQLVNPQYIRQGAQARHARESLLASLLAQRRLPDSGWDELSIDLALHELASMDSNNFLGNAGVGEREGRVFCPLVARRHYRLAHGIGRSGDIAETQPKAAGSSLLLKLANALALDLLRRAGAPSLGGALVLPLATGMSISLVLLAMRKLRPAATHVLWPRLDQKACLKAILLAGLTPVIIPGRLCGDQIETDVEALKAHLTELGAERVLCVLSSTSCFAPRASDKVIDPHSL